MSLDSVDLLVSFENYFGIHIPDAEAEKIRTVNDMVVCISNHLSVSDGSDRLKTEILQKLNSALSENKLIEKPLTDTDPVFERMDPRNTELWDRISGRLGLKLPIPYVPEQGVKKIFNVLSWVSKYNWKTRTAGQFATVICAANLEKVISKEKISTTYEIMVAVTAITVDKTGVDVYEVEAGKSFTDDFGID